MKKQNLDSEVARDIFIEMKYYIIQNYLKKCRHVGFCVFRYRSCSQWVLHMIMNRCSDTWYCTCTVIHDTAYVLCYAIVFFYKSFCYWLVFLLVKIWYLHDNWDSNDWCKFIDISIYKIYGIPFSSCKPKEEWLHIALPCCNESSDKITFYVKWLYINKGQVDVWS